MRGFSTAAPTDDPLAPRRALTAKSRSSQQDEAACRTFDCSKNLELAASIPTTLLLVSRIRSPIACHRLIHSAID